jgi:hypothetical protein
LCNAFIAIDQADLANAIAQRQRLRHCSAQTSGTDDGHEWQQ